MPQIWPMNWLFLLSLFILMFLFFISVIYFTNMNSSKMSSGTSASIVSVGNLNWKW